MRAGGGKRQRFAVAARRTARGGFDPSTLLRAGKLRMTDGEAGVATRTAATGTVALQVGDGAAGYPSAFGGGTAYRTEQLQAPTPLSPPRRGLGRPGAVSTHSAGSGQAALAARTPYRGGRRPRQSVAATEGRRVQRRQPGRSPYRGGSGHDGAWPSKRRGAVERPGLNDMGSGLFILLCN